MSTDAVAEPQSEIIKFEILSRYMTINGYTSQLVAMLSRRKIKKQEVGRLAAGIKPLIIEIVGIAVIYPKFYQAIRKEYEKYHDFKVDPRTPRRARYAAETTLEIWNIIRDKMIEFDVIILKGD
jgi:hypothetical protein